MSQNLTLRSVESSVIEFSEQGERPLRSLENEGIELPPTLSERSSCKVSGRVLMWISVLNSL
ncbi:hypothetical protein [Leptospira santarosai]|uniref:hypothetical protein n=1 Tax=Leptospira santarosai TaxID=28183 RepID=UPI0012BA5A61|nr:hypothetical protein [Leptospira santarosai]